MAERIRVNVTLDKDLLEKTKTKLNLFGGKLSTLFNAYLNDFVNTMDKKFDSNLKTINQKIKELEDKVKHLERKI